MILIPLGLLAITGALSDLHLCLSCLIVYFRVSPEFRNSDYSSEGNCSKKPMIMGFIQDVPQFFCFMMILTLF